MFDFVHIRIVRLIDSGVLSAIPAVDMEEQYEVGSMKLRKLAIIKCIDKLLQKTNIWVGYRGKTSLRIDNFAYCQGPVYLLHISMGLRDNIVVQTLFGMSEFDISIDRNARSAVLPQGATQVTPSAFTYYMAPEDVEVAKRVVAFLVDRCREKPWFIELSEFLSGYGFGNVVDREKKSIMIHKKETCLGENVIADIEIVWDSRADITCDIVFMSVTNNVTKSVKLDIQSQYDLPSAFDPIRRACATYIRDKAQKIVDNY